METIFNQLLIDRGCLRTRDCRFFANQRGVIQGNGLRVAVRKGGFERAIRSGKKFVPV